MKIVSKISILLWFLILPALLSFQEKPTSILFFGDSLTAGYGISEQQAFPALINNMLDKRGENVEIINAGLSGETSAGGKSRIGWILKRPVDILVLELGANDGLRGLPVEETRKNLQAIIDKAREKNPAIKIVIAGMMVPPNLGEEYAESFRSIFPELAEENNATLIPFLLRDVAGIKSLNQADGIHPNVEGHKIVASNVLRALEKVL